MKKYNIKVTKSEYWQEVYDLLCNSSSCENIPDRVVSCIDEKLHSPTRGTFELEENEVEELKNHEKVQWVELSPTDYPEVYPSPSPVGNRFSEPVKIYRDLQIYGPPSSSPQSDELNRINWAIKRVGIQSNFDFWQDSNGNPIIGNSPVLYGNVGISTATGENVDIIIQDSGVLQYHPEFIDDNGQSRVRDIIFDGPYYIDPAHFVSVGVTYTKPDGRVGIAETSAILWWQDSSYRSPTFSSIGTIAIPTSYTLSRVIGTTTNGNSDITDDHGTACAGLSAGKNFGLASKANIWNMYGISNNAAVSINIEQNYDLMKIFHVNKPINPSTSVKNPTIINGSWIFGAGYRFEDEINYKFRGTTGSFTAGSPSVDLVTAMNNGLKNQFASRGTYKTWTTSSRSLSYDEAGNELISSGVIYVAAAGNDNARVGIGSTDPDRLNYMSDTFFGTTDYRSEFPSGTVPCNHRDWYNPGGIGFNSITDPEYHPVILVGAMDDETIGTGSEQKATYSNNGPGIDVWAPADETLTAGLPFAGRYQRRDNFAFYDRFFNGTSAAAPVVSGLIALYLETNPSVGSTETKNWLNTIGSKVLDSSQYYDQFTDDTTINYWSSDRNLREAERRIAFNPFDDNNDLPVDPPDPIDPPEVGSQVSFLRGERMIWTGENWNVEYK